MNEHLPPRRDAKYSGENDGSLEGDKEFDLRNYFDAIDPRNYVLRDEREYEPAGHLFSTARECVSRWAALYHASLMVPHRNPEALQVVVACLRAALRKSPTDYTRWLGSPQDVLDDRSPEHWLRDESFMELVRCVRFHEAAAASDSAASARLCGPFFRQTSLEAEEAAQLDGDDRMRLQLARTFLAVDPWDDEFDLTPFLFRWSPVHYLKDRPAEAFLALEILDVVTSEFKGCVRIYRQALVVAGRRPGILDGIVRCVSKLTEAGREPYLDWYVTPQAEFFGGKTPEGWFRSKRLHDLQSLLDLGRSGREEKPTRRDG